MTQRYFEGYIHLERLPDPIRQLNGIRSKERLDCTRAALDGYKGLESFKNPKGQLFFYKTPCKDMIEADYKRRAEYCLSNGRLNFSSIYTEDEEYPQYGYGYPNANRLLSTGEANPLYPFGRSGYLFVLNEDYTRIEVFIVKDGRNLIHHYYQQLIDGGLDEDINALRREATPLFPYQGLTVL